MKKIGIITVHRAYNYGSVLQCYALQEYLKGMGHEVWVIDYRQRWTEAVYKKFSLYYIWHFIKLLDIHAIIGYWRSRKERGLQIRQSKKLFTTFRNKLHITKSSFLYRMPQDFDTYIIGSDQLWSHQCVGGEDRIYFGGFKHSKKSRIIGYALSASTTSLYKLGRQKLTDILSNFDKISMRETENTRIIQNLTGTKLPITVDPVLLTDSSVWKPLINTKWKEKKFIAIYQARPVPDEPNLLRNKAETLARTLHCDVIDMSDTSYSVEDFISIIKYARCVLTTSFHATVFSVLMETPCYAIKLNDGLDVRYVDILTALGLDCELVDKDFSPTPLCIDFSQAKKRLSAYRQTSARFIEDALDDNDCTGQV